MPETVQYSTRYIRRILVHQQNIQTGVANSVIYDNGVVNTLFTTPRTVHDIHPESAKRCHGCLLELRYDLSYTPNGPDTRRDTHYPGAPAA